MCPTEPHAVPVPVVSVCVQTYRHAAFISGCLDGVLMQETNFPFEIIVGDDESDDGTRELCVRYAEQHPGRIRLFLRSRKDVIRINGKPTGRFNFMENLRACRGTYVALCEGDDYWTDPKKLQMQFDLMEKNPETGICFHTVHEENSFDPSKNKLLPEITADTVYTVDDYILSNRTATCSMFFRKKLLDPLPGWFLKLPFGDLAITLIVMHRSDGKAPVLHRTMGVYRVHGGGTHGSQKKNHESLIGAYQQHLEFTRIIAKSLFTGREHRKALLDKLVTISETLRNTYRVVGNRTGFAKSAILTYYYRMIRKLTI